MLRYTRTHTHREVYMMPRNVPSETYTKRRFDGARPGLGQEEKEEEEEVGVRKR